MCCGVGNLETKHANPRNVFMSTLDQPDIDVMAAAKTCRAATRFQYDYLNDDIADDGSIDYSLTNKVPQNLRDAIAAAKEGKKKFLVLINPPYAEVGSSQNIALPNDKSNKAKTGVNRTRWAAFGMEKFGKASNELFMQFVTRIEKEIPEATLAMFSKLKYINAQTLEQFRANWPAKYISGFVVHSKAFDGLKGDFPIGFLVWKTGLAAKNAENAKFPDSISCEVLDRKGNAIGEKTFYNIPNKRLLTNWIKRIKPNDSNCIPIKNAITPATATRDLRGTKWADGAIGFFWCKSNDMQQAGQQTAIFSSGFGDGHGFYVTEENLWQIAVNFSVRRLIAHTWINDRDQFLIPEGELSEEFKLDCLVWTLFNGSNLTASANGLEWNGKTWSIVNHFIPFTEEEVDAPDRFESDFMVRYLAGKELSPEASAVRAAGLEIWREYFKRLPSFDYSIRERFKLNRADVGWYQIRQSLKAYGESSEGRPIAFSAFDSAYAALSAKLRPQVFEYGFLKT